MGKNILSLTLAGIMILGLIGCGGENKEVTNDTTNEATNDSDITVQSKGVSLLGNVMEDYDERNIIDISHNEVSNKSMEILKELIEFTKKDKETDLTIPTEVKQEQKNEFDDGSVSVQFNKEKISSAMSFIFDHEEVAGSYRNKTVSQIYNIMIEDDELENINIANYPYIKDQLEWLISKGYKIDLEDIDRKINDELLPDIKQKFLNKTDISRAVDKQIKIPIDEYNNMEIMGDALWNGDEKHLLIFMNIRAEFCYEIEEVEKVEEVKQNYNVKEEISTNEINIEGFVEEPSEGVELGYIFIHKSLINEQELNKFITLLNEALTGGLDGYFGYTVVERDFKENSIKEIKEYLISALDGYKYTMKIKTSSDVVSVSIDIPEISFSKNYNVPIVRSNNNE